MGSSASSQKAPRPVDDWTRNLERVPTPPISDIAGSPATKCTSTSKESSSNNNTDTKASENKAAASSSNSEEKVKKEEKNLKTKDQEEKPTTPQVKVTQPNKTVSKQVDEPSTTKNSQPDNQNSSKPTSKKTPEKSEKDMKKEAEATLKIQVSLYEKTKSCWKDSDLTSKELQDHIKAVRDSYTAFGQYPYRIKFDFRGKLATPVINTGTLGIVCDIAVKMLEEDAYFTTDEHGKREILKGQAQMLMDCLQTISSFTDTIVRARQFVVDHGKILPLLVLKLDGWYPLHMDGTLQDIENRILTKSLTVLFMIAAQEDKKHMDNLRAIENFFPVVRKYLSFNSSSRNADNRLTAIATLAYVATEAEAQDIATDKDVVRFLLDQLRQAYKRKDLSSPSGWTITGLAKVVKNLARNDANKRLLVQEGALPVLLDGLKEKNQKSHNWAERKCCMESLWWLSFDPQNREEMSKKDDLLDMVVEIYEKGPVTDHTSCFAAAEGFLFQLQDHIKKKDKYAKTAVKLLDDKSSTADPCTDIGHIMMSYQTQYRPIVKSICDFLREKGFRMWMDIYNMAEGEESTLQTMAEAVEGSAIVLMCVCESYKNSPYCRAEAEYAFMKKKHIIPLKLQMGYIPDGWLGIIQGSKFFYDFTKESEVEKKRKQLLDAVRKATSQESGGDQQRSGVPPSTPRVTSSMEDKVKTWTKQDVKKWLESVKLSGDKLEAMTADEILYLYSLKSEAPEQFHSVVRDELGLTGLSRPAAFNKALDELPSYTEGTH